MNLFFNHQICTNQTLVQMLFGKQTRGMSVSQNVVAGKRDTVTISAEGKAKSVNRANGRTHNTSIDKSIDLESYIDEARKKNQEILEHAGTQINPKSGEYVSIGNAFRAALTEKYSKLVSEAKSHSNPERYIHSKYYDKGSGNYEMNLSDTERRIAYNYEMQMYRTGKINGVNYQDSLFRGIEVNGDVVDADKIQFERQMVNAQISNIFKQAGITQEECTFTIDPYSYEITVDSVDADKKVRMESALNTGNNGKNLFKHIYYCATQDGCNSTQVTKESKAKYEAYQQVYSFTGLKLNELEEKGGTYYTKSGDDILSLADEAITQSGKVPSAFKKQMKDWIHELVFNISRKGWENVPDMRLSILFSNGSLKDINQDIIYQYGTENTKKQWYSVLQ